MKKLFSALLLITVGILFRTTLHLGPNIEFVTTSAILAAMYLGGGYTVLVPLIIMVATDKIIGNTNIYLFTWSAYILIGLFSSLINKKFLVLSSKLKVIKGIGMGIGMAIFFYLWTNFGVWILDSWGMYSRDLNGLIKCYLMGLPFLKLNLVGNLLFIPTSIFIIEKAKAISGSLSFKLKYYFRAWLGCLLTKLVICG